MHSIRNEISNAYGQTQPIICISSIHKHQTRLAIRNNYRVLSIQNFSKSVIFAGPQWRKIPKKNKNISLKLNTLK